MWCHISRQVESRKITIFISAMSGGGTEQIALNLKSYLPNKYDVDIVTLYDKINQDYNIKCTSLLRFNNNQYVRIFLYPYVIFRYLLYRHSIKSDLSISMDGPVNIINLISSLFRFNSIVSFHMMPSTKNNLLSKINRMVLYNLLKITKQHVVVVSKGVKTELLRLSGYDDAKIHTIYNPIDIANIRNKSTSMSFEIENTIQKHYPYIITVARLSKEKAIHHIIRVFSKLCLKQNISLIIVGDGSERSYLENLAMNTSHPEKIVFLGWKDNPYVYMRHAKLFVQSSVSEALPNVIVESMACGCPVVAANCSSGIEELLGSDNKCGLITQKMSGTRYTAEEPLDEGEQSLLESMDKILSNADLQAKMSAACKERAELFDLDVGIQKYVELIDSIITD